MKIKNKNKKFTNSYILVIFFLVYFLFFLSLEKCYEGEDKCCMKMDWIKTKVIEEVISIFLTVVLFEIMIINIISKLHLLHFTIIFLLFYLYSNGITFDDHGYYNIKFFFILTIPIIIFLNIIKYFLYLRNKKILFIYTFLLMLISFEIYFNPLFDCSDWEKGLNNTSIDNNEKDYACLIKIPNTCTYKLGKYMFDRFKMYSPNCYKKALDSRKIILRFSKSPYINKDTIHIGFPIINKNESLFNLENYNLLPRYVSENLIDMNNSTLIKSLNDRKPEVSIDYSQNKMGEIKIDLNFNETLSKERKKLEKYINPYSNNILIVYIDSVSRAYAIRQLKKTLTFFEKFISYKGNFNQNYPRETFHSFQFFKYHSHDHYTPGNYPLLFYGNHRNKTNKYITLYLKRNGYITAYTADNCYYDFVRSLHNFTSDDMFDHHYAVCNPNLPHIFSELKCFHGKLYLEHMFEYMNQFWRKYKNNRKFSLLLTNFAHASSIEILKYMDDIVYEYLNRLFEENLLKDTSVFLLSDHGAGLPTVYFLNDFYQIEKHLPMLFIIVNDRKNETYESQYKYLYQNQQTFISAFDIYNTMIHLIFGDKFGTNSTNKIKSKYGESLFTKINQKLRSPKLYRFMTESVCI